MIGSLPPGRGVGYIGKEHRAGAQGFPWKLEFGDDDGCEDAKFDIAGSEGDKFGNVGEDDISLKQTFPPVLSQDWWFPWMNTKLFRILTQMGDNQK